MIVNYSTKLSLRGIVTMRRYSDERKLLEELEFENLILNTGLDRMGVGTFTQHCRVGSGNTPPQVTDVALQSHIASVTQLSVDYGLVTTSPRYGWARFTYRFAQGAAAGNISEVGIGWNNPPATNLFSRALVKDINGNPATIVVASDEFLDVIYEIRFYIPETDVIKLAQDISGTPTDVTIRALGANVGANWANAMVQSTRSANTSSFGTTRVYSGAIGAITVSQPAGTGENVTTSNDAYVTGSYRLDGTIVVPLNIGNFAGGIMSLAVYSSFGAFQYGFNPPILKNNTQQVTFRVRMSWGRYVA